MQRRKTNKEEGKQRETKKKRRKRNKEEGKKEKQRGRQETKREGKKEEGRFITFSGHHSRLQHVKRIANN